MWKYLAYTAHIWNAIYSLIEYVIVHFIFGRPGSYPGDATAKPLTRRAKWRNRTTYSKSGWKFACDKESIKITEQRYPGHKITGESVGRQVWYKEENGHAEVHANNNDDDDEDESLLFDFNPSVNPNSGDKILRHQLLQSWQGPLPINDNDTTSTNNSQHSQCSSAKEGSQKAMEFYQMLQCSDGHWAGDYGGPMFLMPGLICALYITKAPLLTEQYKKDGLIQYLINHQQEDGGWGTHIECASTMFGTILSYVTLRLLGVQADEDYMKDTLSFIHHHGGALYAPSWAKFWLAVLGVYEWEGINSIPVELWMLPRWFPFHPGRMWCHSRMVYLPMGYLYCKRFVPPDLHSDPVLLSLRQELYLPGVKYEEIVWDDYRQTCCEIDEYSPLAPVMKLAQDVLSYYEYLLPRYLPKFMSTLRQQGLAFAIQYIHAEDKQTNYIDIGPVNKALNLLSVFVDNDNNNNQSQPMIQHFMRVDDYFWVAEDGMKMQGYNGSQCWDTSFCAQAIVEGNMVDRFPECVNKVYGFLDRAQIANDEDNREYFFRHISKGGWPFSTSGHGWPISDCTAEGLKAVIGLNRSIKANKFQPTLLISDTRLFDACNILLSYQNVDGGWATYENNRGYRWYEMLNPSEVFGDIMIDYSYVECSSACITALKTFSEEYPTHRAAEVYHSIQAGNLFLKSIQRHDGSWYGSWGNCFTYGTWFGIEGLMASGESAESVCIQKAVLFLLSKQNPNGGWGESYVACVDKAYPMDGSGHGLGEDGSGVVQTAWALLALMAAESSERAVIDRGMKYLLRKQLKSGDWAQEGISGVFNRSCGITYTAYRNVFPMWALARYANYYE